MVKILWLFAVLSQNGVTPGELTDTRTFNTQAECDAFGETMAPRAADWVRGAIGADWTTQIKVAHRCEADGQPS